MTTLTAQDLSKTYTLRNGLRFSRLQAVKEVSFELSPGRTLALVGQSGSGKSTIAKLLMQLEHPTSGSLLLDGDPIGRHGRALAAYRHQVQMVFQDPFASLNPYHPIGHHLLRPLLLHGRATRVTAPKAAKELLARVNLPSDDAFMERRPHELSGGQRQRVAIARALAPGPRVLVADEPVSMLDVSVRLGVLNLLARLQQEEQLAMLYITHDLATARHFSDEIMVMYEGEIVEQGPADDVILHPQREFTKRLLAAAPEPGTNQRFLAEARRRGVPMPDHLAYREDLA